MALELLFYTFCWLKDICEKDRSQPLVQNHFDELRLNDNEARRLTNDEPFCCSLAHMLMLYNYANTSEIRSQSRKCMIIAE